jgi:methylmalonyl-CoA mutase N-terminal domain/subunit
MVQAVKQNYPQREIADASYELQCEIDDHERIVVGVNKYVHEDETPLPIHKIDAALERKQIDRVQAVRAKREGAAVEEVLTRVRNAADTGQNLMPILVDAARVHATEGEIVEALQSVWGAYTETPVF